MESYPYGFNGMENDNEVKGTGNSYTTEFRQYDPRLGRWLSRDPEIRSDLSPYNSMSNNPISNVDPKGDIDYYNQAGKKIGTDGYDDGRIILVTDKKIAKFFSKVTNAGGQISITPSGKNFVELPSYFLRNEMGKAVDRSALPSGKDKEGGFHEEGGIYGKLPDGTEKVVNAEPGAYANPSFQNASMDVGKAADPNEQGILGEKGGSFHVHPKGEVVENITKDGKEITRTSFFKSAPTKPDDYKIPKDGETDFVLSPRTNQVTIYDKNGDKAKFPLDKFRTICNDATKEPQKK